MEIRALVLVAFILLGFLGGCTRVDYQELEIDFTNQEITILSSDEFVIDSVSVEKFGKLYFSKALVSKGDGSHGISLIESDRNYEVYVDSLTKLSCGEDNVNLGIVIRRVGSRTKVTRDIAMNFEHVDDIQTLNGVRYVKCSEGIDTLTTDRRWR